MEGLKQPELFGEHAPIDNELGALPDFNLSAPTSTSSPG